MKILAIDPGPTQSAYVVWDGSRVLAKSIVDNAELFREIGTGQYLNGCVIEMIACYGMAVGKETFETCVWIGRFVEQWRRYAGLGDPTLIVRLDVKMHLCHSAKAKDANIRQALIDRFGHPGTKKCPGPLFGVTSHCWAALALAVCFWDKQEERNTHGA